MVKLMVDSTTSIVKSWQSRIESEGGIAEIRVDRYMQSLAADVISRACFGSNYSKGQEIFSKFECLVLAMSKGAVGVPGLRYSKKSQIFYYLFHMDGKWSLVPYI